MGTVLYLNRFFSLTFLYEASRLFDLSEQNRVGSIHLAYWPVITKSVESNRTGLFIQLYVEFSVNQLKFKNKILSALKILDWIQILMNKKIIKVSHLKVLRRICETQPGEREPSPIPRFWRFRVQKLRDGILQPPPSQSRAKSRHRQTDHFHSSQKWRRPNPASWERRDFWRFWELRRFGELYSQSLPGTC